MQACLELGVFPRDEGVAAYLTSPGADETNARGVVLLNRMVLRHDGRFGCRRAMGNLTKHFAPNETTIRYRPWACRESPCGLSA